jgi:hypothetical protein
METDGFLSSQTDTIVTNWPYLCSTLEPTRNETLRLTSRQITLDQHKPSHPMPRPGVVKPARLAAKKKLVRLAKIGEKVDTASQFRAAYD